MPDVDTGGGKNGGDPDCFTSTNACRVATNAARELNSGVTNCVEGQTCEGNPINPGAGVKHEQIKLYQGVYPSPLNIEMQFLQLPATAYRAPDFYWKNPYNGNVQILTDNGFTYARVVLPPYSPKQFSYFQLVGAAWAGDPGTKMTLAEVKNPSGVLTGFQVVDPNDTTYGYTLVAGSTTVAGLSSITTHDGRVVNLANPAAGQITMSDTFGHTASFTYNAANMITSMTAPDGGITTLTWDAAGTKLLSILWPDNQARSFLYENVTWPNALTGITDENGKRYATWTYDSTGRATGSWHGDTLNADKVTLVYNADGSTNVTDPIGGNRTYQFDMIYGVVKATSLSQPCTTCGTDFAAATYDANGNVASRTDFNGNKTCYTYDLTRNLETLRLEGVPSGTACPADLATYTPSTAPGSVERKITTQWNPTYRLPTVIAEPKRIISNTYNGDLVNGTPVYCGYQADGITPVPGVLCGVTLQPTTDITGGAGTSATATGTARSISYTYNSFGQILTVNGARTDVIDVTTYTYDPVNGNLLTVSDALTHTTSLGDYDANGRPGSITDPNGLITSLIYDPRGRLTSRTTGTETTGYGYDGVGQLTSVTPPNGAIIFYGYDDAHRLTDITDALGNHIHYTLDAMGNRTKEEIFDALGTLLQTHSRDFDALNRLWHDIGAVNQTTTYEYDPNGNLTRITVPFTSATLNRTTINAYDALNRLKQVTNADNGIIKYTYDGLDQLGSVVDPNTLTTGYTRNGLGDLTQTHSPDTGTATSTYDDAGNLHTRLDAKGQLATYSYDALNRVTGISHTDAVTPARNQSISYQYDQGVNGIGHLTRITDATGITDYSYDLHGRLTSEARQTHGMLYTTGYGYDTLGRLSNISYPSGRIVNYGFDALSRINQIDTTFDTTTVTLVSNVSYEPFGGVHSFTFGDGLTPPVQTYTRSRDLDGRIADYTLHGKTLTIGYNAASQIDAISDPTDPLNPATYGYDPLSRLTDYIQGSINQNFSYDANGNRITKTLGVTTTTYGYPPGSNRLGSIQLGGNAAQAVTQDANGATTADPNQQYGYDIRGRLIKTTTAQGVIDYEVNALGLRIRKHVPYNNTDTLYHYDTQGHLIGESPTGSIQFTRDYIYLGDQPVAVMK